jgi:HAMP domain.
MDWTLVKRIPYETLYRDPRQLTLINSLAVSVFLIIAAAAAVVISYRFTSPIKQLLRYINKLESGNLDAGPRSTEATRSASCRNGSIS